MTSISQPINTSQSSTVSQAAGSSHLPSAPASGKPTQAAGPASAKNSYASATKKTFSPSSSDSGVLPTAQNSGNGKFDTNLPMSGRASIAPAVPTVGPVVNGNAPTASSTGIHSRNPSVTIHAAGAPGYMPNGGASVSKTNAGSKIQFGNIESSPSVVRNVSPQPMPSGDTLAVNAPSNPRLSSPQTSPSPIPQPPASGGKPPSALHSQSNSVNFGNFGGPEGNVSSSTRVYV